MIGIDGTEKYTHTVDIPINKLKVHWAGNLPNVSLTTNYMEIAQR